MDNKLLRRRWAHPGAGLLLGTLFIGSIVLARTITVDDDGPAEFRRIQDAIDAASPGDLVSVARSLQWGMEDRFSRWRRAMETATFSA